MGEELQEDFGTDYDPSAFPYRQYPLGCGVTTCFPPLSKGNDREQELVAMLLMFRDCGFGRIRQVAETMQDYFEEEERKHFPRSRGNG